MINNKRSPSSKPSQKEQGLLTWFAQMNRELPGFLKPLLGFSLAINILLMVSPFYMLQVYDRVLTSGSTDTLIWLTVLAVFLLTVYAAADAGRRRSSAIAAEQIEEQISERIFHQFTQSHSSESRLSNDLMVLGRIRSLFQNQLIAPFLDLPFTPLFFVVLFMIHPIIGIVGLIGGAIIFTIAVIAEFTTRNDNEKASSASNQAFELAAGLSRQRSAMVAMGLGNNGLGKWRAAKDLAREYSLQAGAREGMLSATAKSARQILQISILGAGAALAINQQVSPGAIVAGSIVLSRALAPIDQIVGSWRAITQARSAWNQLQSALAENTTIEKITPLPRPAHHLELNRVAVEVPGATGALIQPFSTELNGGSITALVGANGVGKSTLLQTLSGVWPTRSGLVSLGGRDIHDWDNTDRGPYIGYVPQNVELLPGTIAENIARMSDADTKDIITAAHRAGAHEMILALPKGYDTPIDAVNETLSAGQRQLIGLARALFGDPVLLLMDEPTANLDIKAARVVINSFQQAAKRGAIVVVATHDKNLINKTNEVLLIRNNAVLVAQSSKYLNSLVRKSSVTKINRGAIA